MAAECILRVWQHSSVLEPCKCPICRRAITLLIPFEVNVTGDHQPDLDVDRIVQNLAKYNRIFGGGPVSLLQVIFFLLLFGSSTSLYVVVP